MLQMVADFFPSLLNSSPGFAEFEKKVVPVLDRHCSLCHGVDEVKYQNVKKSSQGTDLLRWRVGVTGKIETFEQSKQLYNDLAGNPELKSQSNLFEYKIDPIESKLLRASLAKRYSGSIHNEIFSTPEHQDYQTLEQWIKKHHQNNTNIDIKKSESELFFEKEVVPILIRKNCFGCHSQFAFNDLQLDPGIPMLASRFTHEMYKHNRKAMLGANTRMVHLSGNVEQSKQLLKNIPIEQGGIIHLGGNNFFEKNDPDYTTLFNWLEMEKQAMEAETGTTLGETNGILYVQRTDAFPERFFEDDGFRPGADIMWLKNGETTNLTKSLHPEGPVDIRTPDISYDAKKVLFSMRRKESEPFNIWELELETGTARQITFSGQRDIHFRDPLYIPYPEQTVGNNLGLVSISFVSNLANEYAQASPSAILGEAESGEYIKYRR